MGDIIDAGEYARQKQISSIMASVTDLYKKADGVLREFIELAGTDYTEAVRQLPRFISRARNINPDAAFGEAIAGPNQDWIMPLVNVAALFYSEIDRESRRQLLVLLLNYLDSLRYDYSQLHVGLLENPLLVADVVVNRTLYWPGLDRPRQIIGKQRNLKDILREHRPEVFESFWVCLAIIWSGDWVSLPLRRWYYKSHPETLERTLDFAAALVRPVEGQTTEKALVRYFEPSIHERIVARMKEEKWIVL